MNIIKKILTICILNLFAINQIYAQTSITDVHAPLNGEKNIFLDVSLPPKGFIFAIESPGLSIALPFVLTGQSLQKYTQKIEIKMFPAPQSITLEELKTGLKELYLRSGCPTLGIVETESNKSEPTIRTETAKATMIEEKVTNMEGYNIFEYGLTCTLNTYGSVIYIRSYAGPSGAFEIIYEKVDKEPSKDHLKEMGQFVDSFVKIQKK